MSIFDQKILHTDLWFIEPMESQMRRHHTEKIRQGKAALHSTAYRRLKRALATDDGLMIECVKLAISRRHEITG